MAELWRRRYATTLQTTPTSTSAPMTQFNQPLPLPATRPRGMKKIPILPPPPSMRKKCPDPIGVVSAGQVRALDPTGARTRLFAKANRDGAGVGDILLVRQRNGDPFAGVVLNVRRRGPDTGVLLRGQLTRVGVEMWFKVYSPNVEGIEIVQKREKRPRRARLYYMRKPKHDVGSVENVVRQYINRRRAMGATSAKDDRTTFRRKGKAKR